MSASGSESSGKSVTQYRTPISYLPGSVQSATADAILRYMGMPTSVPIQYGGTSFVAPAKGPLYGSQMISSMYSPTPSLQVGKQDSQSFGGGCGSCFVFAETERDEKLKELRAFRDERFPKIGIVSSGYGKLSSLLIPLMRRSKLAKALVKTVMVKPLISRAKFYYRKNRIGWLFIPLGAMWVAIWYMIGKYSKTREYTWAEFYGFPQHLS